jgi:hypothetical protein
MNSHNFKENLGFYVDVVQVIIWIFSLILYGYSIVLQKGISLTIPFRVINIQPLTKQDAVVITGLATLVVMYGVTYYSLKKLKANKNGLWFQFFVIFDLIVIWLYLRYWLGTEWLIYICVIPFFILILIVLGWLDLKTRVYIHRNDIYSGSVQNFNYESIARDSLQGKDVGRQSIPSVRSVESYDSSRSASMVNEALNSQQGPSSEWKLPSYTLYGLQNLEESYKELPADVSRHMHQLTKILIQDNKIRTDWDVYNLSGFVNQVKNKKTITYLDVLSAYGKSVADEMKF